MTIKKILFLDYFLKEIDAYDRYVLRHNKYAERDVFIRILSDFKDKQHRVNSLIVYVNDDLKCDCISKKYQDRFLKNHFDDDHDDHGEKTYYNNAEIFFTSFDSFYADGNHKNRFLLEIKNILNEFII